MQCRHNSVLGSDEYETAYDQNCFWRWMVKVIVLKPWFLKLMTVASILRPWFVKMLLPISTITSIRRWWLTQVHMNNVLMYGTQQTRRLWRVVLLHVYHRNAFSNVTDMMNISKSVHITITPKVFNIKIHSGLRKKEDVSSHHPPLKIIFFKCVGVGGWGWGHQWWQK